MNNKPKLIIFASGTKKGGGSGFKNLVEKSKEGVLDAEIAVVVCNHKNGGVKKHADNLGIKFIHFDGPYTAENYQRIVSQFSNDIWVALSGWLKLVSGLDPKRTFNIHPGPLPKFGGKGLYGHFVHKAVLEVFHKGEIKESSICMHFVTEKYDEGPIFFTRPIEIKEADTPETLGKRVSQAEHKWQPIITNLIVNEKIKWDGKNPKSLESDFDILKLA